MVRFLDDFLLVFDDDNGVFLGTQLFQDAHESLAVAWVQSDRRFVEDVEGVHQGRANGSGKIDTCQFAAGESARLAVQREIVQADIDQVAQPRAHFVEDELCDFLLIASQLDGIEEGCRLGHTHFLHFDDTASVDAVERRLGLQTPTMAVRTDPVAAVARQEDAYVHLVSAPFQPAKPAANAVILAFSFDDPVALFLGQFFPRNIGADLLSRTELQQFPTFPLCGFRTPSFHRAIVDTEPRVGHHEIHVDIDDTPETATGLTRAKRAVEGEQIRRRFTIGDAATRTFESADVRLDAIAFIGKDECHAVLAESEGLFRRVDETGFLIGTPTQAINDDHQG